MVVILLLTLSSKQNGFDESDERCDNKTILTNNIKETENSFRYEQFKEQVNSRNRNNQKDENFYKPTSIDKHFSAPLFISSSVFRTLSKPFNKFSYSDLPLHKTECSTKHNIFSQEYKNKNKKSHDIPNFKASNGSKEKSCKSSVNQQFIRSSNRKSHNVTFDFDHLPNFVPKPPRKQCKHQCNYRHENNIDDIAKYYSKNYNNINNSNNNRKSLSNGNAKEYVRHITRVNFYDYESSQVDFSKRNYDHGTKPITKEEEWITKKKTELITTRQIETRVKRQILLENGQVLEDSGPVVFTNTTEDTGKKESESTEQINLGFLNSNEKLRKENLLKRAEPVNISDPVNKPKRKKWVKVEPSCIVLQNYDVNNDSFVIAHQEDSLVRETDDKHVISHEEIDELLETEDVRHLGNFSDQIYVKAVNSGAKNLENILYSEKIKPSLSPKIAHQLTKTHKIVDTEDVNQKSLVKSDGTLVTEKKKITEHEELFDNDLPEKRNLSTKNRNEINATTKSSQQRFFKQRDEQNVEYVADGKTIGKEMRYTAETEQMERDGPHEGPSDWDSLSDRIRKTRRNQKTILQHQKEASILADRKDALTKRPLNFDREEETRKGETMKWLESHFGSESTASSDSRDGDHDSDLIEPIKKTFFNVTIKSNHVPATTTKNEFESYQSLVGGINGKYSNGVFNLTPKGSVPDKNSVITKDKTKYFQGISNWSDRKESNGKHFASKAFKDELQGIVAKNNLRHISREDLRFIKLLKPNDNHIKENVIEHKKYQYASKGDLKYNRKHSREDIDNSKKIAQQKDDFCFSNESKNDTICRRNSNDDRSSYNLIKTSSRLKREDSGYVKDSREDIRPSVFRDAEDENTANFRQSAIQEDNFAYIIPSLNFSDNRTIKIPQLRTPDSGIRSPSPELYDISASINFQTDRPTVPLRKRAIEKKLKQHSQSAFPPAQFRKYEHFRHDEPPPDYSPPPRSRSISPAIHLHPEVTHQLNSRTGSINNCTEALTQRCRFTPDISTFNQNNLSQNVISSTIRPTVSTQTSPQPKPPTKVGQVIGNSFRKLVGKIRSASADRKLKIKSKNKSRERSPSPLNRNKSLPNESTYQQYNVIDSHIGETININENQIENEYGNVDHLKIGDMSKNSISQLQQNNSINRDSSFASSSATTILKELRNPVKNGVNAELLLMNNFEHKNSESYDRDLIPSPKQRYYLGEDPYGNSIFGKENKYNRNREESRCEPTESQNVNHKKRLTVVNNDEYREINNHRNTTFSTLGRYRKGSQQHLGSTPNLDCDSRNAQTLPRKLEHGTSHHSSTINVSIFNQLKPNHSTGPAKPARTYKTLNRSKSFNVHGMNGTNDPSPIYLEKLTKNNYARNIYKSNPHLNESGPQLKSPSIVNLISRSQKDLSRLNINEDSERKCSGYFSNIQNVPKLSDYVDGNNYKKDIFLKELNDHVPESYKASQNEDDLVHTVIQGNNRPYKYSDGCNQNLSLDSKLPFQIVKDTANILRRESSSTEDTNTLKNFSKTKIPSKSTRNFQINDFGENGQISSRYCSDPCSRLKHKQNYKCAHSDGGTSLIEVKGGKLRR